MSDSNPSHHSSSLADPKKSFWRRKDTSKESLSFEKLKSLGSKLLLKSDSSISTIHESNYTLNSKSDDLEVDFNSLTLDKIRGKNLEINVKKLPLLHRTILNGNMGKLKSILLQDININECDDYHGLTPLHLAAEMELPMFAKELLVGLERNVKRSQFANPDAMDAVFKRTPLMIV